MWDGTCGHGVTKTPSARPPGHWAEVLTHLALDLGFGTFIFIAEPDPDTLRTFSEDVAPQVRERVATARTQIPTAPGNAGSGRR